MNKLKLFVENFLVYGLGSIINKIIPFLMLPIITRLMPDTAYFGLNEITNTIVQFGTALAIMGLYDAVFRLFFDQNDLIYQKKVFSTALISILSVAICLVTLIVCFDDYFTLLFFNEPKYKMLTHLISLNILIGATNSIISLPTRVQNKRGIFITMNAATSIISYAV